VKSQGSSGGSYEASQPPGIDWCGLIREEGPLGLLGAPAVAGLCGIHSWPTGGPATLVWGKATLPLSGGGPPAVLGAPPRLNIRPGYRPYRGEGSYSANPLLHRRRTPGFSTRPFPGCVEAPREGLYVGVPRLEPLEAREPGACRAASWRPGGPIRLAGHMILEPSRCLEAQTPWRAGLRYCSSGGVEAVEAEGHMLILGGPVVLERRCSDYFARILHPGGYVWAYAGGSWEATAPAIVLECPEGSIYAASPGGVTVGLEAGRIRVEAARPGTPVALGSGGPLRGAAAVLEALVDPGTRWASPTPGHARCGGCIGLAWVSGRELWAYAWAPAGSPGILEVRLRRPSRERVIVVDALGEDWVPVERGLFRVPLAAGWHVIVKVELGESGRLAEVLKRRLGAGSGA
jgi:hypothetical protein